MNNSGEDALFISQFMLSGIKCFKQHYTFNLLNEDGWPIKWNVILGNNNTGKTTLLKLIANENPLYLNIEEAYSYDGSETSYVSPFDETEAHLFSINIVQATHDLSNPFVEHSQAFYSLSDPDSLNVDYKPYNSYNSHKYANQKIDAYGTHRVMSKSALTDYKSQSETTKSLFFGNEELTNAEEWLLQLDYANKSKGNGAERRLNQLKELLLSQIFPDLKEIKFEVDEKFKPSVLFLTPYGWVKLQELSYGYQSTITWVVDLAKRMFDRYPDLENPLHGPAIVLVDEIDLHLHPEWQRKIIKYLSDLFPNTQFIVTAHSPLIVQSAENVNLIMLEKDDETGSINVRQQFGSFQGWTVEEILRELMDMGEKTRSDRYLELMRQFEDGLLTEDYAAVKTAYAELDKILSPSSHQRKVLQIQMSSLIPA